MPAAPPSLLVLRSLDAPSRSLPHVDYRHLDAESFAREDAEGVVRIVSLADPARVLLNLTVEDGNLLVDGAPFDGAPRQSSFDVTQETWLDEQETTVSVGPPVTYHVTEVLTLRDLGDQPVTLREAPWGCQG